MQTHNFQELLASASQRHQALHAQLVRHAQSWLREQALEASGNAGSQAQLGADSLARARDAEAVPSGQSPFAGADRSETAASEVMLGQSGFDPSMVGSIMLDDPAAMAQMAQVVGLGGLDGLMGGDEDGSGGIGVNALTAGLGALGGGMLNAPVTSAGAGRKALGQNVKVVRQVAEQVGIPPEVAVAMMLVESGGDNTAVGDDGTSFGLFQLHKGGMLTSAGLTPEQAMDPATNARVALSALARTAAGMRGSDWGAIAAASQRPADPAGYAGKVRDAIPKAQKLIAAGTNIGGPNLFLDLYQ